MLYHHYINKAFRCKNDLYLFNCLMLLKSYMCLFLGYLGILLSGNSSTASPPLGCTWCKRQAIRDQWREQSISAPVNIPTSAIVQQTSVPLASPLLKRRGKPQVKLKHKHVWFYRPTSNIIYMEQAGKMTVTIIYISNHFIYASFQAVVL